MGRPDSGELERGHGCFCRRGRRLDQSMRHVGFKAFEARVAAFEVLGRRFEEVIDVWKGRTRATWRVILVAIAERLIGGALDGP